jgi:tRNA A37 N6-isopentenylltransferase MiaA
MSLDDALEATAIEGRQYTKRQRTWIRHQIKADETIT